MLLSFNRALCIVNVSDKWKCQETWGSFNRALCIVNKETQEGNTIKKTVLIEHYVLWMSYADLEDQVRRKF